MKILFIVGPFPKLSETFVLNQITLLIDLGHEVEILSENDPEETSIHQDYHTYNLRCRTIYYNLPSNKICKLEGALMKVFGISFKSRKFPFSFFDISKYGKWIKNLKHVFAYEALFGRGDRNNFDLIICHFGPNGLLGAYLKDSGCLQGKLVTIFHGHDMTAYLERTGLNAYKFLMEKGDLFLPISNFWAQKLIKLGFPSNKIKAIHLGIDTDKFQFLERSFNLSPLRILTVARLVEKKGLIYALESVRSLFERGYKVEFNIIGDGPLFERLSNIVSEKRLMNVVKFLGPKYQNEIISEMHKADVFLLPSVVAEDGDMEGIPVVLMESMACGLMPISTFHSGIPELIQDSITGFLSKEKDVKGLTSKLESLFTHTPLELNEISRNASSYVKNNFNKEIQDAVFVNALTEIFNVEKA